MRVSSNSAFINQAKPVNEPYTTGPGLRHTRIQGVGKIGHTVTCAAPKIGGAPFTLTYEWQVGTDTGGFQTLRHARGAKLKITKAIYTKARPAKLRILFCTATAHDAGGSLDTGLTSMRLKK
jgi:hypothetical protein